MSLFPVFLLVPDGDLAFLWGLVQVVLPTLSLWAAIAWPVLRWLR